MKTELHIPDADAFYEALTHAHDGLSDSQCHLFHAALALLLANQIGEQSVLLDCLSAARESVLGVTTHHHNEVSP